VTIDLVVVSVGTDHHRFDRLVAWMDNWAARNPSWRVVIQRGGAPETQHCESHPLIPYEELCALFGAATVVVSHGGPSTVMDARAAGRLPVVVPRDPVHGEHVDDHQVRFGQHLARHGLATVATRQAELEAAIEAVIASPGRYQLSGELRTLPGVVAFGRVIDELIGVDAGIPSGTIGDIRRRR
jgi:UDP-N-acetylglucosamine transferase subunit ALG13